MTDINKARELFQSAGLGFPTLPEELAVKLKERDWWVYSTRNVCRWVYELDAYVDEAQGKRIRDYAVLSHSGHGINSYAIQYYLVHGYLRMFLHLGWGGAYMDQEEEAAKIRTCFLKADEVVQTMVRCAAGFHTEEHLTVVGSDFYGSYWIPPGPGRQRIEIGRDRPSVESPLAALTEVLNWLTSKFRTSRSLKSTPTKKGSHQVMGPKEELTTMNESLRDGIPASIERVSTDNQPPVPGISVVTKESVEQVLDEIDSRSRPVPKNRNSTKYSLETRGRHYPPKYVLWRAIKIQGTKLRGFRDRGGSRTNRELQNLGYVVREHGCGNTCKFSS